MRHHPCVNPNGPIFDFYRAYNEKTGVTLTELRNKSRRADIVQKRRLFCFHASKEFTLTDIAEFLGIDHSSVIHHRDSHKDLMLNPKYKRKYESYYT